MTDGQNFILNMTMHDSMNSFRSMGGGEWLILIAFFCTQCCGGFIIAKHMATDATYIRFSESNATNPNV